MEAGAFDIQMINHGLHMLDGHVLAARVVEPAQASVGLRVLGGQGDHHVFVEILGPGS